MSIRKFLPLAILMVAISTAWGQGLPQKLSVIDDSSEYSEFVKAFERFATELSATSSGVRGFIALSGKPGEIMPRYKFIRSRIREDDRLRMRLEVTQPGTKYRGSWESTEFWFLATDAQSPYRREKADYDCPALELTGESAINKNTERVSYTVRYPVTNWLDTPYTFKWAVTGGKITSGQGTTTITVERIAKEKQPIVVSIEIASGDVEDQYCIHIATMTTEIGISKPKEY